MKNVLKLLKSLLFLLLMVVLVSCDMLTNTTGNKDDADSTIPDDQFIDLVNQDEDEVEYTCTVESFKILKGTPNETTCYRFHSSGNGPKVFIMGGTHGDEVAGWKAALQLVNKTNWAGDVLLIPQCNILADTRTERYAGLGKTKVNGEYYSDLNRSFPGYTTTPKAATKRIADAIVEVVNEFNPDHLIDLHESVLTAADAVEGGKGVGDLLIYGNEESIFPALEIKQKFNNECLKDGENLFGVDTNAPTGSFNAYFGSRYSSGIVLTIETTRSNALNRRIEQQLQLVNLILDYIYNEL